MCGIGFVLRKVRVRYDLLDPLVYEWLFVKSDSQAEADGEGEDDGSATTTATTASAEAQSQQAQGDEVVEIDSEAFVQLVAKKLSNRGPDSLKLLEVALQGSSEGSESLLTLIGGVLFLRGEHTVQPIVSEKTQDVLLWNGEVFNLIDSQRSKEDSDKLLEQENDTKYIMSQLELINDPEGIVKTLCSVEGPYSFIFWRPSTKTLYFGRDPLGRRSLLLTKDIRGAQDTSFCVASVPSIWNQSTRRIGFNWSELPTTGVFSLTFNNTENNVSEWEGFLQIHKRPDASIGDNFSLGLSSAIVTTPINMNTLFSTRQCSYLLDVADSEQLEQEFLKVCKTFFERLSDSVYRRVVNVPMNGSKPRIGVLFSGGIDSMVVARLADMHVKPADEPIDLINVAFGKESYKAPDRITSINGLLELRKVAPARKWNLVEIDISSEELESQKSHIIELLHPCDTVMDLCIGSALWFASRGIGVIREHNHDVIRSPACRYVTEEETMKVPEPKKPEGTRGQRRREKKKGNASAQAAAVSYGNEEPGVPYKSEVKVLLLGMGADEQLGGYGRHRVCYKNGGWEKLVKEMEMDVMRLWKRNLGRDDRIVSDFGREGRFPFLDETLMKYVNQLPLNLIVNMSKPQGIGDKMLLRHVAKHKLGLELSSTLVKRAIQFGTKIANRKQVGTNKITDAQKESFVNNNL